MATPFVPTFDTTPLIAPIDAKAFRGFAQSRPGYPDFQTGRAALFRLAWVPIIFFALLLSAAVIMTVESLASVDVPSLLYLVLTAGFSLLGIPSLAAFGERLDAKAAQVYRLDRFASANKLGYSPWGTTALALDPALGLIFSIPDAFSTTIGQLVGSAKPVPFRTGFCDVTLPAGSGGETAHWTFLEIILDRELPHIVLDSRLNGSAQLPAQFRGSRQLELEGDFNRSFRVYALSPNARDALYVLAPDVMALLIDNAGQADVEIVGNRLYFYFPRHVDIVDPAWWQWVEHTVATIGAKLQRVSGRSTFTPSEARRNGISYRNRRVRRAARVGGVVLLGVAALIICLQFGA